MREAEGQRQNKQSEERLLALKVEEVALTRGMPATSRSRGEERKGLSPAAPDGAQSCRQLVFGLVKPFQTLDLQNYKVVNVCCFKPLISW